MTILTTDSAAQSLALSSNASIARVQLTDPHSQCRPPPRSEVTTTSLDTGSMTSRPSTSFEDGNITLLVGSSYFVVHRGVLCRHSARLASMIAKVSVNRTLHGCPVLELDECAEKLSLLLHAVYDGVPSVLGRADMFHIGFTLLHLSLQYDMPRLKQEAADVLRVAWPTSLIMWDRRTTNPVMCIADDQMPDDHFPNPIAIINLVRKAGLTHLLPAAFYDLSRQLPSRAASGFRGERLAQPDLVTLFAGREAVSRFLSTFIVQVLEARAPVANCPSPHRCKFVFERMAQEAVSTLGLAMDPLAIMAGVLRMQLEDDAGAALFVLCLCCAEAVSVDVQRARDLCWDSLPGWFGIEELEDWGA